MELYPWIKPGLTLELRKALEKEWLSLFATLQHRGGAKVQNLTFWKKQSSVLYLICTGKNIIITIVITVTMHEDCSGHSILAERWEGLPLCFAYFSACIRITATHSRLSGCPEMVNAYTQGRSHFATLTVKCLSWSSAFQLHWMVPSPEHSWQPAHGLPVLQATEHSLLLRQGVLRPSEEGW